MISVRAPAVSAVSEGLDEITGVLLAITPVIGLSQAVGAVPDLATALGYDIEAALDDPRWLLTLPVRSAAT